MSISWWLVKGNVIICNRGILVSHKKDDRLSFATKWIQLETIMVSEVSQSPQYKYPMLSLICDNEYTTCKKKNAVCEIDILRFGYCLQPLSVLLTNIRFSVSICSVLIFLPNEVLSLWLWSEMKTKHCKNQGKSKK